MMNIVIRVKRSISITYCPRAHNIFRLPTVAFKYTYTLLYNYVTTQYNTYYYYGFELFYIVVHAAWLVPTYLFGLLCER